MQCPNCRYVRQAKDSIIPDWQCPKCGIAYAKLKAALNKAVKLHMVSGQEITFQQIKLYDADLIYRLDSLRQSASRNFAGHSTGLGFWGSLEWVAAGSLILGAIDSAVSNQMAQEGIGQLREIAMLGKKLRESALYVPVHAVANIQYPEIGLWRASLSQQSPKRELIHFNGEYVFVRSEEKEMAVFWDKVEQYELVEMPSSTETLAHQPLTNQFQSIGRTS